MSDIEVLAEQEVTIPNLVQIFKRAFMSTSIDKDGDLIVQHEGVRIIVGIDKEKKLLTFMILLRLNPSASELSALTLVNKLNRMIFVRFYVPSPETMAADYTLLIEEGVPTFQVVASLRLFVRIVLGAVRTLDAENIVL